MLKELRIVDFAIIDEALIEFGPGLNVLTGETGAGKSILIEALGLALGGRSSDEMIRSAAEGAVVEASFDLTGSPRTAGWLEERGIESGGELIIRRTISRSGRNRAFLNGALATVAQVNEAGRSLVDIHGQNEHQALIDPKTHLAVYDGFLGLEGERARYREAFDNLENAKKRLASVVAGHKEMERRIDLLRHQVEEIAAAGIDPGEDERLAAEKGRLIHAEKLLELGSLAAAALDGEETSATSLIHGARARLEQMAQLDPSLAPLAENVAASLFGLEEAASLLRSYASDVDHNPARLEEVDDRLDLIGKLKRKYGDTIERIAAFHEEAEAELGALEFDRENVDALREDVARLGGKAAKLAAALDQKRKEGAGKFSNAVAAELAGLNMGKAVIAPVFNYEDDPDGPCVIEGRSVKLNPAGAGTMEFFFSANPGEPPKPLTKIASGGEMSRLMLALKTVAAGDQPAPVMIFDEIDSGIGGVTADRLGQKLRNLARSAQVFCVTHLAQVARYADAHYRVTKKMAKGRTSVSVTKLNRQERVAELARMTGGAGGAQAEKAARKWAAEALLDAERAP